MTRRLILDAMLGKLATYLRMCGHDTAYAMDRGVEADDDLRELAREEDRTLLTRDRDLANAAGDGVLIDAKGIEGQLREAREAGIELSLDEPERCSACNGELDPVEDGATPGYAPDPDEERTWQCRDCGQYYWKGSHWDDVRERLTEVATD